MTHLGELERALRAGQSAANNCNLRVKSGHATPFRMDKKKSKQLLPVSNVLQSLLANGKSPLSDGFLRWKIWRFWPKIVGDTLAGHCEPVGYDRGCLILWVKSSARMQEIRFFEKTLREKVNDHVGRDWVRKIRFTLDRHDVPRQESASPIIKKYLGDDDVSK